MNSNNPPPAIRATGVVKKYGEKFALDGFHLEVPRGSIHGLLGPNGAGKSTAISTLSTLLTFDEGTAEVAGVDVRRGAEVRRRIGLVGQQAALDEILGGRQNLIMFGRLLGLKTVAARARADELLEGLSLTDAADKPVGDYSGGMRRRLDIAASLILDPDVLFLDEPTTGLDPRGRIDVWNMVTGIAGRGTTVLMTTQYLDEADHLADRISILREGAVIAEGTPTELKMRHGGSRVEITTAADSSATQILAALGGAATLADAETGVITVPAPRGTADVIEVVRALDAAGLTPADLMLRRPTLDEVFLAVTENPGPVHQAPDTREES